MLSAAAFAFLAFSTSSQHARDALRELVEINTTESSGDTTLAAEAMARRLKSAGIDAADIKVLGPHPKRGNLIARLRGSSAGERPVLFLAHLDVVEAKREHWSMDPFKLIERDGYFYGRGTHDNKAGAAILVDMLTRLKRDGIRPKRDLIIALTAGEEGGDYNGVDWLLRNQRQMIEAEFCINTDSGEGHIKNGQRIFAGLQTAEKTFHSVRLEVSGPGGHSSLPVKENTIYRLAEGLSRLARYEFPVHLTETTRAHVEDRGRPDRA